MVSLTIIFWMYVILFAIIGGMRGWAKELLVTFSVILALTLKTLLENYMPFIRDLAAEVLRPDATRNVILTIFWMRALILVVLVFFGYQTPNIARFAAKMTREKFQDVLLGAFLGAFNGYLIFGSIWYYINQANYPFPAITAPAADLLAGIKNMMHYMPPELLGIPGIYFAVVVAFIFVIVVFI
jgi:uncharacterized membrane protein required for colicin V production